MSLSNNLNHQQKFFSSLRILRHASATPITNIIINLELLDQNIKTEYQKSNHQYYLHRALLSAKYLKNVMNQTHLRTQQKKFLLKEAIQEVLAYAPDPIRVGN